MADNVSVTPGTGATIATDDVGGVQYQRVKLVDGTLDSSTAIASGGGVEAGALRVTLANDSTGLVSVDDNGGSLTVDVGTALPAGTNAIGKLAANTGVDIGDVDVTSVVPGTSANNLGKAEDAAHTTGDVGVMALGVRKDTPTALAGTDGDYAPFLTDANGRLHVVLGISSAPGGNTPIKYEDDPSAGGEAGMVLLSVRRNSPASSSSTDGDYVTINSDQNGRLYVNAILAANSGVDIGDTDVMSVVPGTGATNLGKAEDAVHASGDTGVMALVVRKDTAAALAGADGDYAPLEVDANGRLHVNASGVAIPVTDNSGSLTVDGSVTALVSEKTVTIVTGTAASSGDNSLIAAPGVGIKIVVCGFVIQNESSTATTLILRDGTTSKIRCYAKNQGDGLSQVFTPDARWKLTANTALNLNLSGANTCGYTVWYYTE